MSSDEFLLKPTKGLKKNKNISANGGFGTGTQLAVFGGLG